MRLRYSMQILKLFICVTLFVGKNYCWRTRRTEITNLNTVRRRTQVITQNTARRRTKVTTQNTVRRRTQVATQNTVRRTLSTTTKSTATTKSTTTVKTWQHSEVTDNVDLLLTTMQNTGTTKIKQTIAYTTLNIPSFTKIFQSTIAAKITQPIVSLTLGTSSIFTTPQSNSIAKRRQPDGNTTNLNKSFETQSQTRMQYSSEIVETTKETSKRKDRTRLYQLNSGATSTTAAREALLSTTNIVIIASSLGVGIIIAQVIIAQVVRHCCFKKFPKNDSSVRTKAATESISMNTTAINKNSRTTEVECIEPEAISNSGFAKHSLTGTSELNSFCSNPDVLPKNQHQLDGYENPITALYYIPEADDYATFETDTNTFHLPQRFVADTSSNPVSDFNNENSATKGEYIEPESLPATSFANSSFQDASGEGSYPQPNKLRNKLSLDGYETPVRSYYLIPEVDGYATVVNPASVVGFVSGSGHN